MYITIFRNNCSRFFTWEFSISRNVIIQFHFLLTEFVSYTYTRSSTKRNSLLIRNGICWFCLSIIFLEFMCNIRYDKIDLIVENLPTIITPGGNPSETIPSAVRYTKAGLSRLMASVRMSACFCVFATMFFRL